MSPESGAHENGSAGSLTGPMEQLAGELEGVARRAIAGGIEYSRGGVPFAAREGERLSFRLRTEVVEAALRTPDTSRSARGAEWIALEPAVVDAFARDRALAWFESAWRLAGQPPQPKTRPH